MSRRTTAAAGAGGAVAIAAALVISWEGLVLSSHWDRYAKIWDACYGETRGIGPGMTFTKPECDEMLAKRLRGFDLAIRPCLPETLPDKTRAAFISAAYNIGVGGFCGSSMSRKAKAGDLVGACNSLMFWNKAGNPLREVRGLTNRRAAERALCLEGLK